MKLSQLEDYLSQFRKAGKCITMEQYENLKQLGSYLD